MHGVKRKQWTQELLKQKRIQDQRKIASYRELVDEVLKLRDDGCFTNESLKATTRLLQANPEFNAIWNYRREIVDRLAPSLDSGFWNDELMFTLVLLKQYPKVYWIWNHRIWTLQHHSDRTTTVWENELAMVSKLLQLDARNFHGWHYRRLILNKLEKLTSRNRDADELQYVTQNINKDISNYSAWHQRASLISSLFDNHEIADERKFILDEFAYITNAIFTDAEDQSVWFYTKWFIKYVNVSKVLGHGEYIRQLQDLKSNIIAINQDDVEFSGKENNWCLKILIFIEGIEQELGLQIESHSEAYLKQLIIADPLRKNRYLSLIAKRT
ncbi:hypothetical protein HG536_0E03940 [Torulaspora globosa]|uniref:Geranylgeranyl transferase type-2 subunit alpha n=1 Tax=Torulaspora globosa TaxID=48254 RepID=A0A7G3ZIZ7_9SACH|nr:uncharacterized protein HG536_0E03940 [Torulaspora globosa]QLL33483.1 hypothetical protein HG536_0E03940 [Torulaspora globosa]